jgi:biotin carboxyl carrier protein
MREQGVVEAVIEQSTSDSGEILLCSPAVGIYSHPPKVREVLISGAGAGRLTALGRTVELVLPQATSGRVAERMLRNRRDPVEYGQVLLKLVPLEAKELVTDVASEATATTHNLPEGCVAVTSPTHGMFYRRPRPDAPSYVEVGQLVEEGITLALVEVMKCFSAIAYGGEGMPPRAEIVEIRAEDASEVQAGQMLFVVKAV